MGYLDVELFSGTTSDLKVRWYLKMTDILKISKYFRKVRFDIRYAKIVRNYLRKSTFDVDDVTDEATAWRQTRPFIFMFKLNC